MKSLLLSHAHILSPLTFNLSESLKCFLQGTYSWALLFKKIHSSNIFPLMGVYNLLTFYAIIDTAFNSAALLFVFWKISSTSYSSIRHIDGSWFSQTFGQGFYTEFRVSPFCIPLSQDFPFNFSSYVCPKLCSLVLQSWKTVGFYQSFGGSDSKEYACIAADWCLTYGSGRSPREGNGNSLQDSCLENPMDREATVQLDLRLKAVKRQLTLCHYFLLSFRTPQNLLPFVYISVFSGTRMHTCLGAQLCLTLCDPLDCSPPGSRVKVMIFPVVMYRCESWTIKKMIKNAN